MTGRTGRTGKTGTTGTDDALRSFITGALGEQGAAQVHAKAQAEHQAEQKKPARGGRQAAFTGDLVRLSLFLPPEVATKAKLKAMQHGKTLAAYVAELLDSQE